MRRAFTMIELSFIVVIIGILASIAIPRLFSTRYDAEIVRVHNHLSLMLREIKSYYISQNKFDNINVMTNAMTNMKFANGGNSFSDSILAGGEKCIKVTLDDSKKNGKPPFVKLEVENDISQVCQKIIENQMVKNLLGNKFVYRNTATQTTDVSGTGEVDIIGPNIIK